MIGLDGEEQGKVRPPETEILSKDSEDLVWYSIYGDGFPDHGAVVTKFALPVAVIENGHGDGLPG